MHYLPFLFGGALICQISGILFLNCPLNEYTCIFLQFNTVFGPNLMFSAILVKTRKIYNVFKKALLRKLKSQDSLISLMDTSNFCSGLEEKIWNCCPRLEDKLGNIFKEHSKCRQYSLLAFLVLTQFIILCGWAWFNIDW